MKLSEYLNLMPEGEELTVWDSEYDMKACFYGGKPEDRCDKEMSKLSELLTIKQIRKNVVIVNLSEIIESKIADGADKADIMRNFHIRTKKDR